MSHSSFCGRRSSATNPPLAPLRAPQTMLPFLMHQRPLGTSDSWCAARTISASFGSKVTKNLERATAVADAQPLGALTGGTRLRNISPSVVKQRRSRRTGLSDPSRPLYAGRALARGADPIEPRALALVLAVPLASLAQMYGAVCPAADDRPEDAARRFSVGRGSKLGLV